MNARVADTAAKLRRFLTGPGIQVAEGRHAGAVIGALDDAGRARYAYPEITGYYLHWLAEARDRTDAGAAARARAAADWATRALADGAVPATRAYLRTDEPADWRNDAVFFFDLAMLLRGLCAAHERGLVAMPAAAIGRLLEELARFVDADGHLLAARRLAGRPGLPARWSTLGGPFEVKATSRVLLSDRLVNLPAPLRNTCVALQEAYVASAASTALGMLHPTLYFAEGTLVCAPQAAADVGRLLARLLALGDTDGNLPEAEDSNVPRSDIVAQALRVGVLLRARGVAGAPSLERLEALADTLVRRLLPSGAMPFRADIATPQANLWCSMFAEQGLHWFALHVRGDAVPDAEWLV